MRVPGRPQAPRPGMRRTKGIPVSIRNLFRAHPAWPLALAALALAVALLRPSLSLPRDTWDHLVVFDLTQSMNVEDLEHQGAPISRFNAARQALRLVLPELPCGSRVGLGAFAEYRTVMLLAPIEVCENYHDLLASLDRLDPVMRWGNASEITKGAFWAMRTAKALEPHPDLIFFTDGQEAPPLSAVALPLFDDLKAGQVRGWIVGTGGLIPRPIPRTDAEGRPMGMWRAEEVVQGTAADGVGSREHLSSLREAHLRDVARLVGLNYLRLDAPDRLRAVMLDPRFARRHDEPTDVSWLPLSLALALMVWWARPSKGGLSAVVNGLRRPRRLRSQRSAGAAPSTPPR